MGWQQRRENGLIHPQDRDDDGGHGVPIGRREAHCRQMARISFRILSSRSVPTGKSARPRKTTTRLIPPPAAAARSISRSASKAALMSRRILFLFTALNVLLETEKPARNGVPAP